MPAGTGSVLSPHTPELISTIIDPAVQEFIVKIILMLVAWAIPYIFTKIGKLLTTMRKNEEIGQFLQIVETAVQAAEQMGFFDVVLALGAKKKQWAIDYIQSELNARKLNWIPVATIEAEIEAAVRRGVHKTTPEPVQTVRPE